MSKPHIELLIEDESGQDVVAYPFVNAKHVSLSNGMNIGEMIDGDVSMPTVTHDTTAIKVGVGNSDVSSSIVDSAVNMTVKGQTYQNILPDPTLRNEMQGKSMQRLNEGYDNIEVVDGVSKSAILKGQTLVNCIKVISYMTTAWPAIKLENVLIQPNKKYIAILKHLPVDCQWAITNIGESQSVHVQYNKAMYSIFTSSSTTTANLLLHINKVVETDLTLEELQKVQPMVIEYQEGMENWDIPYFEGMQSVKMPVLCTTGKNLFDSSTEIVTGQGISSVNGLPYNTSTHSHTGFLRAKPNTSYTITQSHDRTWVFAYDKNKEYIKVVKTDVTSGGSFVTPNDTSYIRLDVNTANVLEIVNGVQIEEGSTATSYEPYKSNILTTPEEIVLRSLPNGVKDTLNLNTGEYVQRIGEIVLDGGENWVVDSNVFNNTYRFALTISNMIRKNWHDTITQEQFVKSNVFKSLDLRVEAHILDTEHLTGWDASRMILNINKAKLSENSVNALKTYLQQNPITVQYELAEPIIKTVDLSSHENWEKIVLDGKSSENWQQNTHDENFAQFDGYSNFCLYSLNLPLANKGLLCDKLPYFNYDSGFRNICVEGISDGGGYRLVFMRIKTNKLPSNDIIGLKQYLQQNPITIWHQTTTTQDNSIREMLSFANGHIQVSSEAENSLLPFVQYEIPTKNSYHMDLMKANTLYTMKAKTVSGTFTIDGTSYNVNANGTFTSPSSMTDKLLIMNNKTNEEVMLLEGNVIDKTIPYFKGIKSAFEDEEGIEIVSIGKNLFNVNLHSSITVREDGVYEINTSDWDKSNVLYTLKPNTTYTLSFYTDHSHCWTCIKINGNTTSLKINESYSKSFTTDGTGIVSLGVYANTEVNVGITFISIQLEENDLNTTHEPHKSNTTKIPLLSPLRSLPNGVYDEIILNRENNNVKMIRRVGKVVLNGEEDWTHEDRWHRWYSSCMNMARANDYATMILNNSENLPVIKNNTFLRDGTYGISGYELTSNYPNQNWIYIRPKNVSNTQALQSLLSQNPTTVLYELATPIITEIDLEGYPYAYKDGHIFLNSDIVPTTEITYSINQAQQIESANENLQRHEKEISHLQKLIAQYIQVEYESTLLSLKI